ncbi:MAG: DUF423 domain-containing protein [Flavobacteriaceae bacterium]|nr:DUF423 domain-containing protein [Bacteroidia bacterium]MBT8287656.1 DUF423 domain-containing protein [Bacteroidia bacterium]NNF73987.1 DUF423 domain-containing protein [Flavobacteriaceae bacterium]NNK72853.1 DUF423 domain-containing protein [Flavobacteriaceae bacterium]
MNKKLLVAGSLFGLLGVILGAFATHTLGNLIEPENIASFNTGVRYQIYHAFLFLLLGFTDMISKRTKQIMFYGLLTGVLLFSGSIYVLATNALTSFDFKTIALLTPIGGLILILSWAYLLFTFVRKPVDKN